MYVCICNSVTNHQINDAIDGGAVSVEDLQDELAVATTCGNCRCEAQAILSSRLNSAAQDSSSLSLQVHSYTGRS